MKVTVVAGGVPTEEYPLQGIFEFGQAKALAAAGIDVTYLALDFRPINIHRHWGLERHLRDGIQIYHYSLPTGVYRRGLWVLQKLALRLYRKIEKEQGKQDILHTHFYSISAICNLIPVCCGVKMVATEHSSKLNKPLAGISALDRNVARKAYANASEVIAVSECLASRLRENFGVEAQVVGNIVNTDFSIVKPVKHTGFNILSVGRVIEGKRFEDLISAFAKAQLSDAKLTIVGDGPSLGALQNLISKLDLTSKVTLYGRASSEDILKRMAETDLFALLSEAETFGVAYAEALSAGIPVIATRCGGPERFVNSENGVLVKVGDIAAAADAIKAVANGDIKFSTENIKRSALQFAAENIAAQIVEVYNSVLKA